MSRSALQTAARPRAGRVIDTLVIHCSASPNGDTLFGRRPDHSVLRPVEVIDSWHVARGFSRRPDACERFNPQLLGIGYHYVLYTNGAIATGRAEAEIGAHAKGYNASSLGLCLVGTDRFTAQQWSSLAALVNRLMEAYTGVRVVGHRDLPGVAKACPCFDVSAWRAAGMRPPADHIYPPDEAA